MEKQAPSKISRPKYYLLKAEWKDGFSATIKLEDFRKECPCATCKEDEMHKKSSAITNLTMHKPGKNDLKELKPMGNYGVTATWGDGHNTGIYPWDMFREIFEKHNLSDEEMKKLEEKNPISPLPQLKIRGNN